MTATPRAQQPSIIVPGQLTLRTIHGRNGPFNVSRLVTPIGEFVVKDPELEQYAEGKYEGEFVIRYIFPKAYPAGGGMRFEIRAKLDGMALSGITKLSKDEARKFGPQEVDPLEEEQNNPAADTTTSPHSPAAPSAKDPLIDTTPFGVDKSTEASASTSAVDGEDAALFGLLWPLDEAVKLDSTIDRRTLRLQCSRLNQLGYAFDAKAQSWHRELDRQAA
ncbi:hypothetical protein B6S59_17380 [Pseudomonas sp. A46]|nr:DUF3275 family protein [Pseudomonas sp. A46]OWJ93203.1 hypothetical protein B6S59_17380 [Pseudomonas sp. A46]